MKISQLIEMLENSRERLGDVEVMFYDYIKQERFEITGIDNEGDHIDLR